MRRDLQGTGRANLDLLSVQLVLPVPAGKGAGDVDALAGALPLDQGRDGGPAGVGLELVAEVVVVGRGGAEHGRALGQGALDLAMVDGAREVLGRDDGRAGRLDLLLDGQRQARRAVEVGGGDVVLRGGGRVDGGEAVGACLFAQDGRHGDGARLGRGRVLLLLLGGLGGARDGAGLGRGAVAGQVRLLSLALRLLAALLVAHGVAGGRAEAVVGAQVVGDDGRGRGARGQRLRAALTRERARGRGVALRVVEGGLGRRRLCFGGAQCLDRLSPARGVVVVGDVVRGPLVVRRPM